jgi:hypothetical protein
MHTRKMTLVSALAVVALSAGCAGQRNNQRDGDENAIAEVTRARSAIDQAERAGAQRFAAAMLEDARDKLTLADRAATEGEEEEARVLAARAVADAELAAALAAQGTAENAAEEVAAGVEALRRESARP